MALHGVYHYNIGTKILVIKICLMILHDRQLKERLGVKLNFGLLQTEYVISMKWFYR